MLFSLPPFNAPGKSDYCWSEGFLSDQDIDYLLSRPEWNQQTPAQMATPTDYFEGDADTLLRRSEISWMYVDQDNEHIWQAIVGSVFDINKQYFQFDLAGCYEPAQLGTYRDENQGCYNWHSDSLLSIHNGPYRKLSVSVLLSDSSEFEGGELQIKVGSDDIITLEQKKGRAWFFPSWVIHRVSPVTKGVRRSLVLWISGPGFK